VTDVDPAPVASKTSSEDTVQPQVEATSVVVEEKDNTDVEQKDAQNNGEAEKGEEQLDRVSAAMAQKTIQAAEMEAFFERLQQDKSPSPVDESVVSPKEVSAHVEAEDVEVLQVTEPVQKPASASKPQVTNAWGDAKPSTPPPAAKTEESKPQVNGKKQDESKSKTKESKSSEKPSPADEKKAAKLAKEQAYKEALAAKRREAKEKRIREENERKEKEERERKEQEERLRWEEEERERRIQEEKERQLKIKEEEEREAEEKARKKEEEEELLRQKRKEQEQRMKEEAEKAKKEREAAAQKKEEERLARKKRLDMIMRRTRGGSPKVEDKPADGSGDASTIESSRTPERSISPQSQTSSEDANNTERSSTLPKNESVQLTSESLVSVTSDDPAPIVHENSAPLVADNAIKTPFFQHVLQPTPAAVMTPQVQNGSNGGMQLIDFDDNMQGESDIMSHHKPHQNGVGFNTDLLTPTTIGDGHQSNGHHDNVLNDGGLPLPPVTAQDLLS